MKLNKDEHVTQLFTNENGEWVRHLPDNWCLMWRPNGRHSVRLVRAVARDVSETPSPIDEKLPERLSVARAHVVADDEERGARRCRQLEDEMLHRVERHQLLQRGEVGVLQPLAHRLHVPLIFRVGLILVRCVRALQRATRLSIMKLALNTQRQIHIIRSRIKCIRGIRLILMILPELFEISRYNVVCATGGAASWYFFTRMR